jgi:hypothetical protein
MALENAIRQQSGNPAAWLMKASPDESDLCMRVKNRDMRDEPSAS